MLSCHTTKDPSLHNWAGGQTIIRVYRNGYMVREGVELGNLVCKSHREKALGEKLQFLCWPYIFVGLIGHQKSPLRFWGFYWLD